jgi:DNA-directed RNA polymerase specialized sigma24 family protein
MMTSNTRSLAAPAVVGEPVDWPAVFDRDFPRIYNYPRYRLGEEPLAEELAAETFARAWRGPV